MSDEAEKTTPKRKPLSLRKTETGAVKQSFSHGRSKTVVVETKKRRTIGAKKILTATTVAVKEEKPTEKPVKPVEEPKKEGAVLRTLSEAEKVARAAVVKQANKQAEEKRVREAAERAGREKREAEELKKLEETRALQAEDDEKRKTEAETRVKAEDDARKGLEADEAERKRRVADKARKNENEAQQPERKGPQISAADTSNPLAALGGRLKTKKNFAGDDRGRDTKAKENRRRTGKLTIANALDDEERQRSLASVRRAREREKRARQARGGDGKKRCSRGDCS